MSEIITSIIDFFNPGIGHHIAHVTAVLVELSIAAVVVVLVKRDDWNRAFEETSDDKEKAKAFIDYSDALGFSEQAKQVVAKQLNGKSKEKNYPYWAFIMSGLVLLFMSFHVNWLSNDVFLLFISIIAFYLSIVFGRKEYENSKKAENKNHDELMKKLKEQDEIMKKMSETMIKSNNA